ncbi:MAG: LuxR C-terminal-related transcriptional regulator [Bacteroidota bacterium]
MTIVKGFGIGEFESFVENGRLTHICEGNVTYDLDIPSFFLKLRKKELLHDTEANHSLDRMKIFDEDQRLIQFMKCRYGGYDDTPDTVQYKNTTPDYWNCGNRGKCSEEFCLCAPVKTKKGDLTKTEINIIKLIAQDLADKEIADRLGSSEFTIHSHRYNITKKIGCSSKNGIVVFAYEKGIINNK